MNAADRLNRQFDDAAAQAKREGGSSFGNPARGWSQKMRREYSDAATQRGVAFEIDERGFGMFVDPEMPA